MDNYIPLTNNECAIVLKGLESLNSRQWTSIQDSAAIINLFSKIKMIAEQQNEAVEPAAEEAGETETVQ